MGTPKYGSHVGADNKVPVLHRELQEGLGDIPSGVVDPHVDTAKLLKDLLAQGADIFRLGYVHDLGVDLKALDLEPPGGFRQLFLTA